MVKHYFDGMAQRIFAAALLLSSMVLGQAAPLRLPFGQFRQVTPEEKQTPVPADAKEKLVEAPGSGVQSGSYVAPMANLTWEQQVRAALQERSVEDQRLSDELSVILRAVASGQDSSAPAQPASGTFSREESLAREVAELRKANETKVQRIKELEQLLRLGLKDKEMTEALRRFPSAPEKAAGKQEMGGSGAISRKDGPSLPEDLFKKAEEQSLAALRDARTATALFPQDWKTRQEEQKTADESRKEYRNWKARVAISKLLGLPPEPPSRGATRQ